MGGDVVIRRTMAGLRAAGIVRSEKGHGGGWSLARAVDNVSRLDVNEALGEPTILAMQHRTESPGCAVEKAVNRWFARGRPPSQERELACMT